MIRLSLQRDEDEKQGREPRFAKEPYSSKDPSIHNISFLMCVECFRTELDFVSGLCWLNIRENRKKDLQLEKLQKKYILSSSKRQTLLNCSGGLALGFVSWWKRKWPNWGGVWSMRGRWRQLSRRSCRYPITGYHAGNMKAYKSYQNCFEVVIN